MKPPGVKVGKTSGIKGHAPDDEKKNEIRYWTERTVDLASTAVLAALGGSLGQ